MKEQKQQVDVGRPGPMPWIVVSRRCASSAARAARPARSVSRDQIDMASAFRVRNWARQAGREARLGGARRADNVSFVTEEDERGFEPDPRWPWRSRSRPCASQMAAGRKSVQAGDRSRGRPPLAERCAAWIGGDQPGDRAVQIGLV